MPLRNPPRPGDIQPQGAGSGLDADLLDGYQGSELVATVAAFGHSGTNLFSPLTLWLHNTLEGWVGSSYNGANGGLPFIDRKSVV